VHSAQVQQSSPSDSVEQSQRKLDEIKNRHNLIHVGGNDKAVTVVTGLMTREQLDQIENEIKNVMGAKCKVAFIIK
jgi:osmotically-inducible protein OsmY